MKWIKTSKNAHATARAEGLRPFIRARYLPSGKMDGDMLTGCSACPEFKNKDFVEVYERHNPDTCIVVFTTVLTPTPGVAISGFPLPWARMCHGCQKTLKADEGAPCTGCGVPLYCNIGCQTEHFMAQHRVECARLASESKLS